MNSKATRWCFDRFLKVDWDKAVAGGSGWRVAGPGPIKVISSVIDGRWYTTVHSLQSTLLPAARLVFYQVCSTPVFILYTLYLAKFTLNADKFALL